MELRLADGDYVSDGLGDFQRVSGAQELLQRVLFRLQARRGAFPLLPELGSRLYLLPGTKPSQRQGAAEQYVREALSDEKELTLTSVALLQDGDELAVTVRFEYAGSELALTVGV